MAERLEVQVGADIKELQSKLAKAIKILDKLKDEQKELKKAFDSGKISAEKYYNSLARNTRQLDKISGIQRRFRNQLASGSKGMQQFGQKTANAVPAVTEFSRVIQDAPFGIQGVANNITQLTQQFGNLSTKLGGSKAALSAMLGTLSGPAGILLAVSTVTSLLVSFGGQLFNSKKDTDEFSDSTKKANDELKDQKRILDSLIKTHDERSKRQKISEFNTIKEREELKALTRVLIASDSTREEQVRALTELQKRYKGYFDAIEIGDINAVLKAESAVTKQLINKEKRIQTLNKLEEIGRELQIKRLKITKIQNETGAKGGGRITTLQNEIIELRELQKNLRSALELYTALDKSLGKASKGERPVASQLLPTPERIGIQPLTSDSQVSIADTILPQDQIVTLQQRLEQIKLASQSMSSAVSSAFGTMKSSISQSLTQSLGIFGTFISSFISAGLDFLNQYIAQLIQKASAEKAAAAISVASDKVTTASKVVAAKTQAAASGVAAAANTAATLPLGAFLLPALITGALGALSGAFQKNGLGSLNSSGGGSVSGGVSGGTTRSFGSSSSFTGSNQGFSNVVFEIKGTDLVGVLSRTLERNRNLGGSLSIG